METNIKQRIAAGALALSLLGGTGVGVAAQGNQNQTGGAAGLVAAVVQANDVVDVYVVDSLNNLTALNNILNNSPILSENDIDVTIGDINILNESEIEVVEVELGLLNLTLDDVVAIGVLDNGSILVFV